MKEQTHFFIKIYLSHFILERVYVDCVWEMSWRRGQTVIYWPSSTSFSSWLGCLTVGHWGPKALCLPIEQFQEVNGVSIIQDDCLVEAFGSNSDQAINNYNQNLWAYLQRCKERNIKINLDKCKFLAEEVTYMGHTNAGLKPDEEKVRVIIEFPASHNLHHLRRFIGMVI